MKKLLLHLPLDLYDEVKEKATKKGLPVAVYLRMIIIEKVRGE